MKMRMIRVALWAGAFVLTGASMTPHIRRAQTAHEIKQHYGAGVALLVVGVLVTEVLSHWPRIWAAVWGLTR